MTEAWLLIDEEAIRKAADNPNGTVGLSLPPLNQLEKVADPKVVLRKSLIQASAKSGRRLHRFKQEISWRVQRVADLIEDFDRLRRLEAFRAFEQATQEAVSELLNRSAEA